MPNLIVAVAIFAIAALSGTIGILATLPPGLAIGIALAGALLAALVGVFISSAVGACSREAPRPDSLPTELPASDTSELSSRLRHDLRGTLSVAMLCADQLSTNENEAVRKRAEQILNALDRATALIRTP